MGRKVQQRCPEQTLKMFVPFPYRNAPRWLGQRLQVISIAEGGLAVLSKKDDDQLYYEGQDLKFSMGCAKAWPGVSQECNLLLVTH